MQRGLGTTELGLQTEKALIYIVCMCVSLHLRVCAPDTATYTVQRHQLESQDGLSHLTWVPGTNPGRAQQVLLTTGPS